MRRMTTGEKEDGGHRVKIHSAYLQTHRDNVRFSNMAFGKV